MRRLLVVLFMLCFAGVAMAANLSTTSDKLDTWVDNGDHASDGREGGETIATAVVIGALPYSDSGATCDNVNDYDEVCPYTGSVAQDVVYAFTPASGVSVDIDLCNSLYDTKLYVYAGAVGNLVACNDDAGCGYSGYQSKISNLALAAGTTYYIVVDGYGTGCGTYALAVSAYVPCAIDCAGTVPEGEPPCVDNYYDSYNGGCNSLNWTPIVADGNGVAAICGLSCTYLYNGGSYRDTDWYTATASPDGGLVTITLKGDFPTQLLFIYGLDCAAPQYDYMQGAPCQSVSISRYMAPEAELWPWIGPSVFAGVPESPYRLDLTGLFPTGDVPVTPATWGTIKNLYK